MAWQRSGDARYVERWAGADRRLDAQRAAGLHRRRRDRPARAELDLQPARLRAARPRAAAPVDAGVLPRACCARSHEQVEFLCANLTPKRNHRTLELLAIFLAGVVFPEFARAAHWRELRAARDAGQPAAPTCCPTACTASCRPTTTTWCCATGCRCASSPRTTAWPCRPAWTRRCSVRSSSACTCTSPHGGVPSLSDGDARGYRPAAAAGRRAVRPRRPALRRDRRARRAACRRERNAHFADSGYHVLRSGWGEAATRCAAPGVRLRPARRGQPRPLRLRCRFELAAFGRSLVVDPGRYTYSEAGETNWRVHFRGTAAHNTVVRRRPLADALRAQGRSRRPRATRRARCATRSPARRPTAR